MNIEVELFFKNIKCPSCNIEGNTVGKFKGKRWGIYCKYCGRFIKWADSQQSMLFNARRDWVLLNEQSND